MSRMARGPERRPLGVCAVRSTVLMYTRCVAFDRVPVGVAWVQPHNRENSGNVIGRALELFVCQGFYFAFGESLDPLHGGYGGTPRPA